MKKSPVAIVTFNEVDNLGVGYLSSTLSINGFDPHIIDIQSKKEEILNEIRVLNPSIVGFSLIFQYHIWQFKKIINYLRKEGIDCHFTAGGYFASLRYEKLFEIIPSLDSIVRFEGEYTFLELVDHISSAKDWKRIKGIAFKNNGSIIANPLRELQTDLDKFPYPVRLPAKDYALCKKATSLIAGRGCVNNCSFCNAREYFKQSSGPIKRYRKPEKVVDEMEFLFKKEECSVFLFEDDDFPVKTSNGSDWIKAFCDELVRKNLIGKIMWKINCRPDEIDFESFQMMKNHGLYLVFLGLDDGTDIGLARLNKQLTVKKSLEGIEILKSLNIGFDYGFMLFQPSSTFESVKTNLDFLRQICRDGYTSVTFLRLMPYFETRIEQELRKEGRIKGRLGFLSYDFQEESLNYYYEFIKICLMKWLNDPDGLVNVSKWARNYIFVFSHFYKITPDVSDIFSEVKRCVSESNLFLLDAMHGLLVIFKTGNYNSGNWDDLLRYKRSIRKTHDEYIQRLIKCIKGLINHAEYQEINKIIHN